MIKPIYPQHSFRIKEENGKEIIFDELRRIWVRLTPEEWVRQNTIQYLLQELQYPSALIGIEKQIMLGELQKRFDLLVYDRDHKPWMIVECKAMHVALDQAVLEQVLRYNISLPVPFLVVTNGGSMAGFERSATGLIELHALPQFAQ